MCVKDSKSTNPVIANERNYRPTLLLKCNDLSTFFFACELTTIYIGYMFTTLATGEGENANFIVLCRARVLVSQGKLTLKVGMEIINQPLEVD